MVPLQGIQDARHIGAVAAEQVARIWLLQLTHRFWVQVEYIHACESVEYRTELLETRERDQSQPVVHELRHRSTQRCLDDLAVPRHE